MFKPMLAKQFHKHRDKVVFPVLVQPKIDGLRLLWDGEEVSSRSGKDSLTVPPAILEELKQHWRDWPLDGELYSPSLKFEEMSGTLRRRAVSANLGGIKYWIFDAPLPGVPFVNRNDSLYKRFTRGHFGKHNYPLVLVPTWYAHSFEEIDRLQSVYLERGFEGVMVRDPGSFYEHRRTHVLLKYKKVEQLQAVITGFKVGAGKHSGRLGALVTRCPNGKECSVGTGFDDAEREDIWANQDKWMGKSVLIEYQEQTKYGVPRFPVYKATFSEPGEFILGHGFFP